ncbi:hypothetical protein ACFW7J_26760 [Streptomyces sp. NPDC059525]|uniref:hypothetical protein n=1 Tax=Streptomyces sp. NPDC059525 TaxID=3346857 RepID=UPI0036C1861B
MEEKPYPADRTPETTVNAAWVPFMAVKDDHKSASWKLADSPLYRIERRASWYMHRFVNNTSSPQSLSETVTVGVEKDGSDTFSAEVGISVSAQVGVSSGVASASVTTTYSLAVGRRPHDPGHPPRRYPAGRFPETDTAGTFGRPVPSADLGGVLPPAAARKTPDVGRAVRDPDGDAVVADAAPAPIVGQVDDPLGPRSPPG